jgi:hypothetical protein
LLATAGLQPPPTPRAIVEAVRAIPYGRTPAQDPHAVLEAGRGTCSTKHYLLAAALAELDPSVSTTLVHRVYRLGRRRAGEIFGRAAAAAVPRRGLVDVHTYLVADIDGRRVPLDVTFPAGPAWDGRSPMPLWCGEGRDVLAGPNPDQTKRELVRRHCDPRHREPFIAALTAAADL